MSVINVAKAFTLSVVEEGQLVKKPFAVGIQDVEDFVADHWYTKAHTEPLPDAVAKAKKPADTTAKPQG
ncbi:STY1053 family phage-associated protein [Silvimonas soli]|uniref:STY1053 family phage-associated protein n=1 Tax=Silvimonas soli TaxID=2980100 RepID=UPI0024B32525|nr:hypothetical protein [Silvimonas soli]